MKCYRIHHKPTGLFFCPSREVKSTITGKYVKSNLSKQGKVYTRKPQLGFLGEFVYSHIHEQVEGKRNPGFNVVYDDWEIVEV